MDTRLIEDLPPPPSDESFYTWSFPGSPVRILLSLDIVAGLSEYLTRPQAGHNGEAGGLLLGSVNPEAVQITAFAAFALHAESESHFAVSAKDRQRFKEFIEQFNQPDSPARVVGYFRSHRRDGLCLNDEDLTLIKEFFNDPAAVFLIVKPDGEEGTPSAGFFFWSDGDVFAECTFMPFPFEERLLRIAARPRTFQDASLEEGSEIAGRAETRAARKRIRVLALAAVLALAMLAVAATLWLRHPASAPAGARYPLALTVRPGSDAITVAWNSSSEAVKNARVGVLSIFEDNRKEEVPLNGLMLQSGRLVYKPSGKTVQVALEVFSPQGQSTRETMTVVMTRDSEESEPAPAEMNQAAKQAHAPSVLPPAGGALSSETAQLQPKPSPMRFQMPPPVRQPDATPSMLALEPPSLEPHSAPPRQAGPAIQTLAWIMPEPPAPKEPPPAAMPSPAPAMATSETPVTTPPATPPVSMPQPIPPKPIQQVWPELSAMAKGMVTREVVVQVRVVVDATGRVTAAEPVPGKGAVSGFLGKSAATAAKLWRFDPAQADGKPVPSEVVLVFRFAPSK